MIKPLEARELSSHGSDEEYWTKDADKMIRWAASKGRHEVHIITTASVARKLRKMGYHLFGFGSCYRVRW